MTDPSISLDYRPPQIDQPAQVFSQYANLRNLMNQGQLQQQQIVAAGQENQQRAIELKNEADTNKAVQANIVTDPTTGRISINHDGVVQALGQAGNGVAAMQYQKNAVAFQTGLNTLAESNNKLQTAHRDNLASVAASILDAPPEARALLYPIAVKSAIANHQVNPGELPAQYDPSFLPQLEQLRRNSGAQSKLDSAAKTAGGRVDQGQADLANAQRLQGEADFKSAVSNVLANPPKDAASYQAQLKKFSPAVQARLQQVVPGASYDPAASPGVLQRAGQSPAELATSTRLAATADERSRHDRAMENTASTRADQGQQRIDNKTANGGLTPGQATNVAFKNDAQYQAALKDEAAQDALNSGLQNAIKQGDYYVDNKGQPVPWSRAVPQLKNEEPEDYQTRLASVKPGFISDMQTRRQAAIKAANAATVRKNAAIVQNGGTPTVSNEQAAAARGGQQANGPQQQAPPVEGTIVRSNTNPKQRLILRGGKWTPLP
jgi:hypothetical protein